MLEKKMRFDSKFKLIIFRQKIRKKLILLTIITVLMVTTLPVFGQSVPNWLEMGKNYYQENRFNDAVEVLIKAANNYEILGDIINQAQSRNYLAWSYENMGDYFAAEKAIEQTITLLKNIGEQEIILAQAFDTQARIQLAQGKDLPALDSWEMAEKFYQEIGDKTGVLGSKINQAQALQNMGMYNDSCKILLQSIDLEALNCQESEKIGEFLNKKNLNLPLEAIALQSLGVAFQAVGNLPFSQKILEKSLRIFQKLELKKEMSSTLLNMGNTAKILGDTQRALDYYQQAGEIGKSLTDKEGLKLLVKAQINQLSVLLELNQLAAAQSLIEPIITNLNQLPPHRDTIYSKVYLAKIIETNPQANLPITHQTIAKILAEAVQESRNIGDKKAEAYALGTLGRLYENNQQFSEAQQLTEEALKIARELNALEIIYQWEWQLARLLNIQGDVKGALAANKQAFNTLQSLRGDMVAMNTDAQFSFQQQIEPIYRNLVSLLLTEPEVSQANLKEARKVIETLQLAELENYFRLACLNPKVEQIETIIEEGDRNSAVIYPIILPARLAVILSLPGKPLLSYNINISQQELEQNLGELRQTMSPALSNKKRLELSQQVYNWLIQPEEKQLVENGIKTLVFVLDGALRNLPMAALYDGNKYLIEKYSVVLTPGLQLLEGRSLEEIKLRALTGGLTASRNGFTSLPGVKYEVGGISKTIPTQVLLDEEFSNNNLEKYLQTLSFPVVHLATHGQFSSQPEKTFLLTWDGTIDVTTFVKLLKNREQNSRIPIELLVLSACQTASGDDKAALGLAGLAVRSGARSIIATLWSVNDQSTADLMVQLYNNLLLSNNKAEALRQAQLSLLKQDKYNHPYYWAPFVLLGNWL